MNGASGANGETGANGRDGQKGRDGVRYDRFTGSYDTTSRTARFRSPTAVPASAVPAQNSWAQIRSYPKSLKVKDIERAVVPRQRPQTRAWPTSS